MRKKNQLEDPPQEVAQPETELPPGVKLKHTLRGHTGPIGRIAWSPDGRMLASPSADSTIRLWNSETGQCVRKLKGQGGGHECVAFDPAGKTLAAKNFDGTVGLWDIASGNQGEKARFPSTPEKQDRRCLLASVKSGQPSGARPLRS